MEEWVPSEEELGFDEPVTVETGVGTVTYQFNPGVIYVTDRVQEYLVEVQHDSILYFLDNLPQEWTPLPGNMLAAGCSHKIPFGLNHRVLSVENVGGLFKVVCTKAALDEVYKELSYCIDADLSYPDLEGLSADTLAMLGYEQRDSVLIDWSYYDAAKNATRNAETRGDKDTIVVDDAVIATNEILDITIDSRKVLALADDGVGKMNQMRKDLYDAVVKQLESEKTRLKLLKENLYLALGVKVVHYEKAHAEKDAKRNYEANYVDSWTDVTLKAELGIEKEFKPDDNSQVSLDKLGKFKDDYNFINSIRTQNGMEPLKPIPEKAQRPNFGTPIFRFNFMAGPVPMALIAQAKVNPTFTISGSVCASCTYTTQVVRTGYFVENGEKHSIEDEIQKEGDLKFDNVILSGKLKVGANFRASAGLEVAYSFACTVGINLDAFIEAEANWEFTEKDNKLETEFSGNARFYIDLYGDVQIHVAPLGIPVWDKQIGKFLTTHLLNVSYTLQPELYPITATALDTEGIYVCTAKCTYKNVEGINPLLRLKTYRPGMLLYYGPIKDQKMVFMALPEDAEEVQYDAVEAKVPYIFSHYGTLEGISTDEIHELHFVPMIYAESDEGEIKDLIKFEKLEQQVDVGNPLVMTRGITQTYGGRNSYDFSGQAGKGVVYVEGGNGDEGGGQSIDASTLNKFKMMGKYTVYNGSRIKTWGVKVHVYNAKDEVILRRRVPINKNVSGTYTIVFSFLTNWEPAYASMHGLEGNLTFRLTPYWEYEDEYNGASVKKEGKDAWANQRYTLKYPMDDISPDYSNRKNYSSEWGEILPEKEL